MLAVFSDLFVWYQIPIFIVLVLLFFLLGPLSKAKSKMPTGGRWILNFVQLFIMFALFVALVLPTLNHARNYELLAVCKTRLKGLGTAIELYHQSEWAFPPSWKELVKEGYASAKNFKCPLDAQDRDVSYFYLPPLETDEGGTFIMCDFRDNHKDNLKNRRIVLLKKNAIQDLSEEQFQAELKQPYNARFAEALKKAEGP